MANSQRISDLEEYFNFDDNDLIIVSTQPPSGELKSVKMTFGTFYSLLKAKLIEDLTAEFKNPPIIRSLAEVRQTEAGANKCIGAEVIRELESDFDAKLAANKPRWN